MTAARSPLLAARNVTGRLIAIGDVHGCYDELVELLERVAPSARDTVVSVGDMVRKGPSAARCLDLWRERGYLAVRGNNEITLLAHARPILRFFAHEDRDVLRHRRLLNQIRAWPLAIDFQNAGVAIVHGGFLPDMSVTEEDIERERDVVPELRWIRKRNGRWKPVSKEKKRKSDRLWSDVWDGDRFVVYGHTPSNESRVSDHALGLDTGCVYGGKLTAAILENDDWSFVSVKARRAYAK